MTSFDIDTTGTNHYMDMGITVLLVVDGPYHGVTSVSDRGDIITHKTLLLRDIEFARQCYD